MGGWVSEYLTKGDGFTLIHCHTRRKTLAQERDLTRLSAPVVPLLRRKID